MHPFMSVLKGSKPSFRWNLTILNNDGFVPRFKAGVHMQRENKQFAPGYNWGSLGPEFADAPVC